MIIRNINEVLNSDNLHTPIFNVLVPDDKLYKTLLLQPIGKIECGNYFVKNSNNEIENKIKLFISLALEKTADLVVTPEYSCPWNNIKEIINNNQLPSENKLWIIGCESIKVKEFMDIKSSCTNVKWIHEEITDTTSNKFLDPVCYIFKAKDYTNTIRDVVLVQFKTHQMGSTDFETDRLILGNTIYVFRNNEDSVHLLTLICSDSLICNVDRLGFPSLTPCLIIHIQLNQKPFNMSFSNYRRDYYCRYTANKEFLCLNWARNSILNNAVMTYGGSAFYSKSPEINTQDEKVCKNHSLGMYYSRWKNTYAHVFFFNYDEYVFEYDTTKVSQHSAPIQNQNNTGPRMINSYKWNSKTNVWESIVNLDDDFSFLCNELSLTNNILNNLNPINRERLLLLSTGEVNSSDWFKPINMKSFNISSDGESSEPNSRFTFLQDPYPESYRKKYDTLIKYKKLCNIMTVGNLFPESITGLIGNCEIDYLPETFRPENFGEDCYHYNLYSTDRKAPATIAFIGFATEVLAQKSLDDICKIFNNSQSSKRVVVWYDDGETILSHYNKNPPKIGDNTNTSITSIRKRGEVLE